MYRTPSRKRFIEEYLFHIKFHYAQIFHKIVQGKGQSNDTKAQYFQKIPSYYYTKAINVSYLYSYK